MTKVPRSDVCKFSCPKCGTEVLGTVPGEVRCADPYCEYRFRFFGKRDKEKAEAFYLTCPSKRLKHLQTVEGGRLVVSFSDKVEPFVARNLLDLIDARALQTIQEGLSARLKRPMTVMFVFPEKPDPQAPKDFTIQVMERNGRVFGRVSPIDARAYFCKRCRLIRNSREGDQKCLAFDMDTTWDMMISREAAPRWSICWAGLADYAFPVVINDFVVGVFLAGQIQWTDTDGEKALEAGCTEASRVTSISEDQLLEWTKDTSQWKADKRQLIKFLHEWGPLVKTIGNVAENTYWAERRVRESDFLSEVFASFAPVEDEESLWTVLRCILARLNEFAHFKYSGFLLEDSRVGNLFHVTASGGIDKADLPDIELLESETARIFGEEALISIKEEDTIADEDLHLKVLECLGLSDTNCLLLFPCKLGDTGRGFILLSERTQVMASRPAVGRISNRRREFLERVGHDIKMEIQNVLTISKLRQALEDHEQLMATSAHVLVAPLASAYGKAEHLRSLVGGDEPRSVVQNASKVRDLCRSIDEDILHCISKTRSFLCYTKMGKVKDEYVFSNPIDLGALIQECVDNFRYAAEKRGITIDLDIQIGLPKANLDKEKMKIVLHNLLDNAVKYSHQQKTVIVAILYEPATQIYRISVSDFGLGIPQTERIRIFEPFYRSLLTDPRRFIPGTGIGLTVVREIVTAHGGRVWVTSVQGPGTGRSSEVEGFNTTFWIEIHRQRRQL